MQAGKACGIKYRKAKKIEDEPKVAYAEIIIANAAIPNVVNDLLPQESTVVLKEKIKYLRIAPGIFTIYIRFKNMPKSIGNKYYSTFVLDESVKSLKDIPINNHDDFSRRSFVFVDYSQIDSDLAPEGKAVGAICAMDYIQDWENLSREDYLQNKKDAAEKILARLEEVIPGINEIILDYEIGTAKTIKRYTLNPGTAMVMRKYQANLSLEEFRKNRR